MKRIILIVFICLNALITNAQTEKGKILITSGSNISFIFGNNSFEYDGVVIQETTVKQITFEPSIGVFIINNLAVGLSIPFDYTKSTADNLSINESSYGLAPFVRYYLTDSKVKPYLNFDIGYLIANTKSNDGTDSNDTFGGIIADGGIGISAFFSDKVAFDTQLMYGFSKMTYNGDTDLKLKTNAFGLIVGITITF